MKRACLVAIVVGAALAVPAATPAQVAPPGLAPPPAEPSRRWTVTLSPMHLIAGPFLEVTGEYAAAPKLGVAAVLGGGRFTFEDEAMAETTAAVFEAGGSLRWYAHGSFSGGVQVGLEVLYIFVDTDDVAGSGVAGSGDGLQIGPMIGYKYVGASGFTFDAQGGVALGFAQAEVEDSTASDRDWIAIVNLNLGWSF